jgi:hypothetical protein
MAILFWSLLLLEDGAGVYGSLLFSFGESLKRGERERKIEKPLGHPMTESHTES